MYFWYRWQHEFSPEIESQVSEYHFNTYCENWERPEVKMTLANVPALMSWDDHDIFDGAGSYPPLLHDSPVMAGLFLCAQRYRLLFQHHTTPELARSHQLFGARGHNFLSQCGPKLAILLTDGRTERTIEQVKEKESWDMIWDKLDGDGVEQGTEHLIGVFAVPLSMVRIKLAENLFSGLVKLPNKYRQMPLIKGTNSIFGLPELYDDLLDEWTHDAHIEERNMCIKGFQKFAVKRGCRVTFLSGDVHCAGKQFLSIGSSSLSLFTDRVWLHRNVPVQDPSSTQQERYHQACERPEDDVSSDCERDCEYASA